MKCENCPVDVPKLKQVEVANLITHATFWICEQCLEEEKKEHFVGYIRETGQVRESEQKSKRAIEQK
ncbi:MAG: hypothetical protein AB1349_10320 [Elusimicrobiota bacterium]